MRKVLLLLSLLLAAVFAAPLAGCVRGREDDEKIGPELSGTLKIRMFKGGFGDEFIKNVAEAFKAKHPKVNVTVYSTEIRSQILGDLVLGKSQQQYDLYFTEDASLLGRWNDKTLISGYDKPFLELGEDVYNHKPSGESLTISEKIAPYINDYITASNGAKYYVNYGVTAYGLTYLPKIVAPYLTNGEVPRTTDELETLCKKLRAANINPIVFSGNTNYYNQIFASWWAQYAGLAGFNRFFTGKAIDDETGSERYSPDIFAQPGRAESFVEVNRFIGRSYGDDKMNSKPSSEVYIDTDSISLEFMPAQTRYLNGGAAMMVNGGWLENEMKVVFKNGFPNKPDMMELPIISAIRNHPDCATIGGDAELSALIKAIDSGSASLTGTGYDVSQAAFDKVAEARGMTFLSGAEGALGVIPATSYSPGLSKEFLKFMYSDEGIDAYTSALSGCVLPVQGFDFTNNTQVDRHASALYKTSLRLISQKTGYFANYKEPLVALGGLSYTPSTITLERAFAAVSAGDRKTPNEMYMQPINFYNAGSSWTDMLKLAGLI